MKKIHTRYHLMELLYFQTPEVAKESTELVASDPEELPAGFLFKVK